MWGVTCPGGQSCVSNKLYCLDAALMMIVLEILVGVCDVNSELCVGCLSNANCAASGQVCNINTKSV